VKGNLLMLWWSIGVWLASGVVIPVLWLLRMAYRGVFFRDSGAEQRHGGVEAHGAAIAASTAQSAYGVRRLATSLVMWAFRLPDRRLGAARMTPVASHMGRYALSGLVSFGVLILLYVGSFSDSIITMRDLPSFSVVAQPPVPQAAMAEAMPIQPAASAALSPSPAQLSAKPAQADTDDAEGMIRRGSLREPPSLGETGATGGIASIQPQTGNVAEGAGDNAGRQVAASAPPMPIEGALPTAPVYPKVLGAERGPRHRHARGLPVRPYATGSSRGTWLSAPNPNGGANS
jgi:hypothetical protein